MAMLMISTRGHKLARLMIDPIAPPNISVERLNKIITETLGEGYKINAAYLREFLIQLVELIENITEEFNTLFGKNIFA
ncbi:MAG: hypothetical protein RBQ88_02960 [Desulfobulbus oligotrophicus]|jgi:hypothetical protein|nr:hypothetical protein [Desulfobulbus oligotrophicus]